jgi:hypothetical protein
VLIINLNIKLVMKGLNYALSLLIANCVAQKELFTTSKTSICSQFCLDKNDIFCTNIAHSTGTCF